MNKNTSRIISVLLCIALLCGLLSGCSKQGAAEKPAEEPFISADEDTGPAVYVFPQRTPVPYSEMSGGLYDQAAADGALEQLKELCTQPHTLKQLKQAYDTAVDQFDRIYTDVALSSVAFFRDVTDETAADRNTELELEASYFSDAFCTALAAVLDSPYREEMIKYISCDDVIDDVDGYEPMEDEEFRIKEENSDIIREYHSLSADPGASAEDFCSLYLRLLDNRLAMAAFDDEGRSPAAIYYEGSYGRDYLPEDTASFREWVRSCIVPLVEEYLQCIEKYDLYGGLQEYYGTFYSQEDLYELVLPCISRVSPEAAELADLLRGYGLADIDISDKRADVGMTVKLFYYGVPYIFIAPSGTAGDAQTLIHETGHGLNDYSHQIPALYVYQCKDTSEIQSQGMEMLMLPYAAEIFGESAGTAASYITIYKLLSNIVISSIFDEFQQKAFEYRAAGKLQTPRDVEKLYLEVEGSYGISYGYGETWYTVMHSFEVPFYVISYATSATSALSLLAVSLRNWNEALKAYDRLIAAGDNTGYSEALKLMGLPDPFTPEGQSELSEQLTLGMLMDAVLGRYYSATPLAPAA